LVFGYSLFCITEIIVLVFTAKILRVIYLKVKLMYSDKKSGNRPKFIAAFNLYQ